MSDQFRVITLSYKTAPLETREAAALDEADIKALYLTFKDVLGLNEAITVSTCNRTEIYYKSEKCLKNELIKLLALQKGLSFDLLEKGFVSIDNEDETLNHLFAVSLGLESQVIGDQQISNQIKNAYQWSADLEMAGPYLHRVLHTVFYANKRIVQETAFRDGAASTSYITVDMIESFLNAHSNILVLGLGEIGIDVAKTLSEKGIKNVKLATRDFEKAKNYASQFEYEAIGIEDAKNSLGEFDIIISSLRIDEPFITNADLGNKKALTYLFDLSLPRSIDPKVQELPGVILYGLDEIQQKSSLALEKRKAAIPEVEKIIAEVVSEINNWSKELLVSPTIQKLKNALEQIRQEEMARYVKGLSETEVEKVEKITSSMMQKIIKLPVLQLKAACKRGEAETLIDVLNDLFNLEKENV